MNSMSRMSLFLLMLLMNIGTLLRGTVRPHIIEAVVRKDIKAVQSLIVNDRADINIQDSVGITPLLEAVINKNLDIAELLLDYGANPNISDNSGATPLIKAIALKHKDMAELLLNDNYPVDVNRHDKFGKTALMVAQLTKQSELIELLLNKGAQDTNFQLTSSKDLLEVYQLLDSGRNINDREKNGYPPLINAINRKSVEAVKMLLKHGADVNKGDIYDFLPLYYTQGGSPDITKVLLEHGADPNRSALYEKYDKVSPLPLTNAINSKNVEVVKILLEYGADVNRINGVTREMRPCPLPLIDAINTQNIDIVRILLEYGADVDIDLLNRECRHWSRNFEKIQDLLKLSKAVDEGEYEDAFLKGYQLKLFLTKRLLKRHNTQGLKYLEETYPFLLRDMYQESYFKQYSINTNQFRLHKFIKPLYSNLLKGSKEGSFSDIAISTQH